MKLVHSPHHGHDVKIGGRRRPASHLTSRIPKLSKYVRLADLPTAPTSIDYTAKATESLANIYKNNALGCCVVAGYYHLKGVATGNADGGQPFVASDDQIVQDYSKIGGYVPGDPSTDNGCDEVTALNYWHSVGDQAGTKIDGYVAVDPSSVSELQLACWLFECLYFGVGLPDGWISPFPSGPGYVWDVAGAADPNNGHCFMAAGYDGAGFTIDSWGMIGKITPAAIAAYCTDAAGGAVYAILTPDMIAAGQQIAPNGIDWASLQSDLAALGAWPQP